MTPPGRVRFGLWYDFRNPQRWRQPPERLYAQILDQIAEAERLGLDSVWLTEHHFCDDGYTPSPLVLAAAIATRTGLRVGTNLMLLPLHDPVRLAEDGATLSIVSGGRFDLGVGLGYRKLEFDAFGRKLVNRPSLMEEGVEIIRRAWAGKSCAFSGRRFSLPDVQVTPAPEPGHVPQLLIGGMSEPAIERVARLGDGFLSTQNAHQPMYLDALARAGKDPSEGRIYAGQWAIVDEDPEATWARIGDHAVYQLNEYVAWGAFGDGVPSFEDAAQVRAAGAYQLWDADTAVRELTQLLTERPQIVDVHFWAQLPGEPVESGSQRVEYLATRVVPEVRARLEQGVAAS